MVPNKNITGLILYYYFSYNRTDQLCKMAYLTFLEEPDIGYSPKVFHIGNYLLC